MSSSIILTNCLFCSIAILLLLPLLRLPSVLVSKKGIPIFIVIILASGKMLLPYEFSFTYTLASKKILPTIREIEKFQLLKNVRVGNVFFCIWLSVASLLLLYITLRYWKLIRTLSIIPEINNKEIVHIFSELCEQKHIRNKPKVVQLNIKTGPFIVGLKESIIVLPFYLSENEIRFIFMHELEHYKNRHNLIKSCLEIVAAIYWWNPIVWLLRKEIIRALEIHADTNAMRGLTNKEGLSYLETLINISKKMQKNRNTNLALSFVLKNNIIEYRIRTALKYECYQKGSKASVYSVGLLILPICLLLISFTYTFESYNISPLKVEGTFTVDPRTDYFILREDQLYDMYINGEYVVTIPNIPEDLLQLTVH